MKRQYDGAASPYNKEYVEREGKKNLNGMASI